MAVVKFIKSIDQIENGLLEKDTSYWFDIDSYQKQELKLNPYSSKEDNKKIIKKLYKSLVSDYKGTIFVISKITESKKVILYFEKPSDVLVFRLKWE